MWIIFLEFLGSRWVSIFPICFRIPVTDQSFNNICDNRWKKCLWIYFIKFKIFRRKFNTVLSLYWGQHSWNWKRNDFEYAQAIMEDSQNSLFRHTVFSRHFKMPTLYGQVLNFVHTSKAVFSISLPVQRPRSVNSLTQLNRLHWYAVNIHSQFVIGPYIFCEEFNDEWILWPYEF
jgi:hypothetical protein